MENTSTCRIKLIYLLFHWLIGYPCPIGSIHRYHTVGGANGTTMVVIVVGLLWWGWRAFPYYSYCRKATGREFSVPARTLIAVKLLKRYKLVKTTHNVFVFLGLGMLQNNWVFFSVRITASSLRSWLEMSAVGDKRQCRQFLPRQANFGDLFSCVLVHFCVVIFQHWHTTNTCRYGPQTATNSHANWEHHDPRSREQQTTTNSIFSGAPVPPTEATTGPSIIAQPTTWKSALRS